MYKDAAESWARAIKRIAYLGMPSERRKKVKNKELFWYSKSAGAWWMEIRTEVRHDPGTVIGLAGRGWEDANEPVKVGRDSKCCSWRL